MTKTRLIAIAVVFCTLMIILLVFSYLKKEVTISVLFSECPKTETVKAVLEQLTLTDMPKNIKIKRQKSLTENICTYQIVYPDKEKETIYVTKDLNYLFYSFHDVREKIKLKKELGI